MGAVIVNFRKSRHRQYDKQMILNIGCSGKEDAKKFVGKEVIWKSPAGKEIKGKVSKIHGNSGCVRVIFEKGMPGQSVGANVEVR